MSDKDSITPQHVATRASDQRYRLADLEAQIAILRENETRYRRFFEQSAMGILLGDATGALLDANPMALTLLGYAKEELLACNIRQIVHPDDQRSLSVTEAPDACFTARVTSLERRYRCKNGTWLPVQVHLRLFDAEKAIYQAMFMDISARRAGEAAREAALAQAEAANRAKSAFLAHMNHEIRTPLNGIMGMLQLALAIGPTPEMQDYLGTAMDSAKALLRILSDILDVSRIDSGRMLLADETFNLDEVLAPIIDSLSHEAEIKGLAFYQRIDPATPVRLRGDPGRLRQILYHLTANAIKYTPAGQVGLEVTTLAHTPTPRVADVEFTVADTGIGIPAAKQEQVFEAFYQADPTMTRPYGGSGLGLAIVRGLAELMGGRVTICSQEGQGTQVRVRLRFDLVDKSLVTQAPDSQPNLSGARILVVEDEAINRLTIRTMLQKLGCQTVMAENGRQALDTLANHDFDCVLMDVQMPVLDGLTATRAIRDAACGVRNPHVPIIALTAHAMPEDRNRAIAAGVNDYIVKPVEMDALARSVSAILSGETPLSEAPVAPAASSDADFPI